MFWNGISADRRWTLDFYGIKNEEDEGDASDEFIDDLDPDLEPCPGLEPARNVAESEKRKDLRQLPPGYQLRQELFGGGIDHCWLPLDHQNIAQQSGCGMSVSDQKDVRSTIFSLFKDKGSDKEYAHDRLAAGWFKDDNMKGRISSLLKRLFAGKNTKTRVDAFANVILFAIDHQPNK
jgi:hypothetical protein